MVVKGDLELLSTRLYSLNGKIKKVYVYGSLEKKERKKNANSTWLYS